MDQKGASAWYPGVVMPSVWLLHGRSCVLVTFMDDFSSQVIVLQMCATIPSSCGIKLKASWILGKHSTNPRYLSFYWWWHIWVHLHIRAPNHSINKLWLLSNLSLITQIEYTLFKMLGARSVLNFGYFQILQYLYMPVKYPGDGTQVQTQNSLMLHIYSTQ